jgi:hypothetical protein
MFWSPFERWLTDGIPQITERSARLAVDQGLQAL